MWIFFNHATFLNGNNLFFLWLFLTNVKKEIKLPTNTFNYSKNSLTRLRLWSLPLADHRHDTIHDARLQSRRSTFRHWQPVQRHHSHSSRRHYDWWHDYDCRYCFAWMNSNAHSFWHDYSMVEHDCSWNCSFFVSLYHNKWMTYFNSQLTQVTDDAKSLIKIFSLFNSNRMRVERIELFSTPILYLLLTFKICTTSSLSSHSNLNLNFYCRSITNVSPQPILPICELLYALFTICFYFEAYERWCRLSA